jgi:hypothetical protein
MENQELRNAAARNNTQVTSQKHSTRGSFFRFSKVNFIACPSMPKILQEKLEITHKFIWNILTTNLGL